MEASYGGSVQRRDPDYGGSGSGGRGYGGGSGYGDGSSFDFESGVNTGLERADAYGLEPERAQIEEPLDTARGVIENWPTPLSGRFQAMFAENVAVASSARVQSEDQPLEGRALRALLGVLEVIFDGLVDDE